MVESNFFAVGSRWLAIYLPRGKPHDSVEAFKNKKN